MQYSRGGWVDYVWVCAALAGANTLAIYLLYPESNFRRPEQHLHTSPAISEDAGKGAVTRVETISRHRVIVVPKPWLSIWTTLVSVDHEVKIMELLFRPLKMILQPAVILAVFIYGTSLASQVILMYVCRCG